LRRIYTAELVQVTVIKLGYGAVVVWIVGCIKTEGAPNLMRCNLRLTRISKITKSYTARADSVDGGKPQKKEDMRMYTIQELRAMHKLSKPEFKKAIEKANRVANTEVMSKESRQVITALAMACESYDEVIDQLFDEIDRLNSMKVE
jgi:hypothetical protein